MSSANLSTHSRTRGHLLEAWSMAPRPPPAGCSAAAASRALAEEAEHGQADARGAAQRGELADDGQRDGLQPHAR